MSTRFQDDGRTIWDFTDDILVACPGCGGCAHVLPKDPHAVGLFGARRVSCLHCGYARDASTGRAKKARPRWEKERWTGKDRRQVSTSMFEPAARRIARRGPVDTFLGLPLYLQTSMRGRDTLGAQRAASGLAGGIPLRVAARRRGARAAQDGGERAATVADRGAPSGRGAARCRAAAREAARLTSPPDPLSHEGEGENVAPLSLWERGWG